MKNLTLILFGILYNFLGYSQLISYRDDKSLSDTNGQTLDSLSLYFPTDCFREKIDWFIYRDTFKNEITKKVIPSNYKYLYDKEYSQLKIKDSISYSIPDTFMNEWFSYELFKLKEPVLSNFYLGREIYRLTIISSSIPTFTIRIETNNKTSLVYTKKLERKIEPLKVIKGLYGYDTLYPNNNIPFSIDTVREITISEIQTIRQSIDSLSLFHMDSYEKIGGVDGSVMIFESHTKSGYYFANRFLEVVGDPVYIISKYFKQLSDLKNNN